MSKYKLYFLISMMILALVQFYFHSNEEDMHAMDNTSQSQFVQEMTYSEFLASVEENKIVTAKIADNDIEGETIDGAHYHTRSHWRDGRLIDRLIDGGVDIEIENTEQNPFIAFFLSILPFLLFLVIIIWFLSRSGKSGRGIFSVGKSKAKLASTDNKVTFSDVAGIEEARDDLTEIVEYLRNPQKFLNLGGKIPKGVLLVGPPGTGKTLTAKAVAGEAGVPFYSVSGSDFVEMFVGVGASRVRDMFQQARKTSPSIIFVDEIDAIGRKRGGGMGGGNEEREQTLNQLLVEMDGFDTNEGVILIAATNRPDVLDSALLRPGRFDRQVIVSAPDISGREAILKVHSNKIPLGNDVDIKTVARGTPGFSGADLSNLVNESALIAARHDRDRVSMEDFEKAKDKILMGSERKSMVMTDEEKKLTAYHEAGHALVSLFVEGNDPLHKVTIIPRGKALGVTMSLPERDRHGYTKKEVLARMAMMFGGRVAEELIFGEDNITTGAGNDIQQATRLARKMVREWGMSENIGPIDYAENETENLLGISAGKGAGVSDHTAKEIDREIVSLIVMSEEKAKSILIEKMDILHELANALLDKETLNKNEIEEIVNQKV